MIELSVEKNKALANRWSREIWGKGDQAAIGEILADNFVFNYAPPGVPSDKEGYKQFVGMMRASFTEISCQPEEMVAEGDKVAVRWTWKGKHTSDYMGIPPTGKQVTITGISILRIKGDKIVEENGEMSTLGMMQQLGMIPT